MDLHLTWDRSHCIDLGSSARRILHYHLIPELVVVVVVTVGAARFEALAAVVVYVVAGAYFVVVREDRVGSQQRLL